MNNAGPVSLRQQLARKPRLADGFRRVSYPTDRIDLRTPTAAHVVERGVTDAPLPLETLHRRVAMEHQVWSPSCNAVDNDDICKTSPAFRTEYHRLIKHLARDVLGYDVVFEETP